MPSVLRQLQIEWNALVPQAQALGLRGVRPVALYPEGLHERIPHRRRRLEWLRRELGLQSAVVVSSPSSPVVTIANTDPFTFGAELECYLPSNVTRYALADRLTAAGVPTVVEGYNHIRRENWKIVDDGSLGRGGPGIELVSPVLSGEDGMIQLRTACEVMSAVGCKITKQCGFHVHVGARNENLDFFKNLIRMYANAENLIDSLVSPSRRDGNPFCGRVNGRLNVRALDRASTMDDVVRAIRQTPGIANVRSSGRYCKINLQSWYQHGTFEFRQHQGTVDPEKATQWVRFCLRMAQAARVNSGTADSVEALLSMLGASEEETNYFLRRRAWFAVASQRNAA